MKHTPGPWTRVSQSVYQDADAGGKEITFRVKGRDNRDEIIANANLIAAAPELLDICEVLMGILTPKQYSRQYPNVYRKAREITKRAKGEL